MMNTDREDLRLLITEFNDGPMGCANDFAWRRHLKTYESLLAEVKRLRKQLVTYADFVFWVDVEHNVSFDEYERRVGLK